MERRKFIKVSAIAASLLFIGCGKSANASIANTNELKELIIPPLLEGTNVNGVVNYDLDINKAKHNFFSNIDTDTYAMNGTYLAPTLKLINNDTVSINYTNNLDESTTMHGHGMHVPASMDGAAHQVIEPGDTWSAQYTVNQKACTNWYHPHKMGKTAEHVYKGLAGLIIVEDDEIKNLDLPKTYGVDDIPLILQDRFFDSSGRIDYSPSMRDIMMGYVGDTFIVNGVINPYIDIPAKEVRFRILNGSNSSVYNLTVSEGLSFKQIATDNSLLESPVAMNSLRLSPAERAEIVIDFSQYEGKSFTLNNDGNSILIVNVKKNTLNITSTPQSLTNLTFHNIDDAIYSRTFSLSSYGMGDLRINGRSMDKAFINEVLDVDDIEIWEITNTMNMHHNFHIHATHFTIIQRNGSSANVSENEKGYKDTVFIAPRETVKIIVKMTDYTDEVNPYMYHCHFLEHEDAGMMGQFTVV